MFNLITCLSRWKTRLTVLWSREPTLCLLVTKQAKDQTLRFTPAACRIYTLQLKVTLGTLLPNKVECGEYYSSSSTQQQHLIWIQAHFSPWSTGILGRYSNFFCCPKPLLFSCCTCRHFHHDVLFFCGPARPYKFKKHAHLQMCGTGGLQMSSLLKKSNIRTIKHLE